MNPSQGIGTGRFHSAYADSFIVLDLMKGADVWYYFNAQGQQVKAPDGFVQVDDKGWATDLPLVNGQPSELNLNVFYTKVMPPAKYVVEWTGEGSVSTYGSFQAAGPNRIIVDYNPVYQTPQGAPQDDGVTLRITSSDPNNTGNYVRDIKMYDARLGDLVANGERFDPDYFQAIDDFRVIRTHEWHDTNFSTVRDWTPQVESADQAAFWGVQRRGAPWELMVQIANETRSDLWVNIPHLATDDFMRQAAAYIKENLDKDLRVYVEYSNEYFTGGFDQNQYFIDEGQRIFGNVANANALAYGARAAQMAQIFTQAFGTEAARLYPTISVDDAAIGTGEAARLLSAADYAARGLVAPKDAGFRHFVTDGYLVSFTAPNDPAGNARVNGWIAAGDDGYRQAADYMINFLNNSVVPNWQKGRMLADQYGMTFGVYEGGALLINGNGNDGAPQKYTDFNLRFHLTQEMARVYEAELAAWKAVGTAPFAWFADVGRPGYYGDYGLWNNPGFVPEPRTQAILDYNAANGPWWANDTRPASTFDNGLYDADLESAGRMFGTNLGDRLYALEGNDVMQGRAGDDQLFGGLGNDWVTGGAGSDRVVGGNGTDRLNGNEGNDRLWGGLGDDIYVLSPGRDIAQDWREGDRVALPGANGVASPNEIADIAIAQSGANTVVTYTPGSQSWTLILANTQASTITLADDFLF